LMAELVAFANDAIASGKLPVPIIAGLAHYQFATIHPYLDGNGRTARLLTTLILRRAGYGLEGIYSLDEHYAKNLRAYYTALTIGHHNYYEGRAGTPEKAPAANLLRELDPRQRRLLALFNRQGSATSEEMAKYLKLSPRTVVDLCRQWVDAGFLEVQNPSRKARSYRLAARYS
jgi:Fic/DOC family